MTNTSVYLEEYEVIRLVLQFLNSRKLHKSMRNLERESGVTNCSFTEDVVFLRQLILDGEWDAILTFAKPLENIEEFDIKKFRYLVLKEKFMEVLYFKSGAEGVSSSYSIEDLVKCLNQLEQDCPFKSDYTKLCWLLTVPDLQEQPEYKDWNPETARIKCFREILELLKNVMPVEKRSGSSKTPKHPTKDRLVTLIIKGLCFESCVDYCHQRAINGEADDDILAVTKDVLGGTSHESTGNFLSWLSNLPQESFLAPFEPMSLDVDFKKAEQSKRFRLSNKRLQHEAENLSKSLSLSPRPSTADNAPRPTIMTQNVNTTSKEEELNERSQSALASVGKVSSSYGNFQYRGESQNVNFQRVSSESNAQDAQNGTSKKSSPKTGSKNVSNDTSIVHKDYSNTLSTKKDAQPSTVEVQPVEGIRDSQDSIDRLKTTQESSVLKRLEEHEQRQMELRRQLMNDKNSPALLNGSVTNGVAGSEDLRGEVGVGNNGKMNYVRGGESPRNHEAKNDIQMQKLTQTAKSTSPNNENMSHSNERMCRESPVGKEVSPSFKENDGIEAPSHYAVTSTPLTKMKLKPEPLSFDTINYEASHLETKDERLNVSEQKYAEEVKEKDKDELQGVSQFPKTPKSNSLPPGHWIALKDGSGFMNTSTPKSCREKMSNTPGPPASPVGVSNNQRASDNNGLSAIDGREDMSSDDDDEKVLQNEENQAVGVVDNSPPRRGPMINGVRRTLVSTGPPMPPNKSATPPEERREAKAPRQERPTSKTMKQDSKGKASPRDQKQVPLKKMSKEEVGSGKRRNSGTTFVVNKDPPTTPANQTYQKPANQEVLPSSIAEPKSTETTRLMERQREHLASTSEPISFCNVASLEDAQAIRAVAFHPSGELFAIGSNSKTLRVCSASGLSTYKKRESMSDLIAPQPTILFKRNRHHKGSIYCIAWNNSGNLLATGSNDKSIKVVNFDAENCTQIGPEMEMNIHSGTVRDLAFASRSGGSNVIVSGGAGNGNILISDSGTGNTIGQLTGHSGHIMSVFAAKDDIIASGSNDNTVRLWDLRSQRCIDVIATGESCVASVCVNPTCSLLASGHEDGGCMIYDITAGRTLQFFKPHTLDCRSVRFSPNGRYLLTGSYDTSIILLDMQHNLECNIPPYSVIAQHKDKVIQCRWHPYLMAFVSSSADKTSCLWTLDC